MEAKAYDVGGKSDFVRGSRVIRGEHLVGGVAGGGRIPVGTGEEDRGEAG
jgi:hypothetical protein